MPEPRMRPACPCDPGRAYDECCRPYHRAPGSAPTAEALMRSRYSAFVKQLASYLLQTWHPATRPPTLQLDPHVRWSGLEVLATAEGGPTARRGTVEFLAHHTRDGAAATLHELSRFRRQGEVWLYVRGRATWTAPAAPAASTDTELTSRRPAPATSADRPMPGVDPEPGGHRA